MNPIGRSVRGILRTHAAALKQLARKIHASPEIGLEEVNACEWHTGLLRDWGFTVRTPFAGLPTAYKATWGRGRPVFCFMAEYDALPEIGHGCGHNLIGAAAMGAGKALAELLRWKGRRGTVVVMGTPAEEGMGGKVRMIARGALDGLDAAIMAHPSWRTIPDCGCSAIKRFSVSFRGQEAHAAASPEKGRNALDAVMLVFQGVNAWRQQLPESCRIHGIVKDGGVMANIIPGHASCIFYLRAMEDEVLEQMVRRFRNIVKGATLMTGASAEVAPWQTSYKARVPNGPLSEAYVAAAREAGLHPVTPDRPSRASSDFGDVSHKLPAAHVYFGIARSEIPVHSPRFCKAAGSAFGLDRMVRAAEALAVVGYRYMTDARFRAGVHADFRGRA